MRKLKLLTLPIVFLSLAISAQSGIIKSSKTSKSKDVSAENSEPKIFAPGIISTMDREAGITFMPDGKTAYFTKWSLDFRIAVILESKFKNGNWQTPTIVSFSGKYKDQHPHVSPNGKKMFFVSNRPVNGNRRNSDIWVSSKTAEGWSDPVHLGAKINGGIAQYTPTVTSEGTLYFSSSRIPEGKERKRENVEVDIYRAAFENGEYSEPEKLNEESINSEFNEFHSYISPDGRILIFTSLKRPDGFGDEDLYVSFLKDGKWTKAKNLGEQINTKGHDYLATISPDGNYVFYTSIRPDKRELPEKFTDYTEFEKWIRGPQNGQTDIYQIDLNVITKETK